MKTQACQLTVRDAYAFIQEPALGLALYGVLGADMKQGPRGVRSLMVDAPTAEKRDWEMTSLSS